jgi:transketolase C-terminal domain/subunit
MRRGRPVNHAIAERGTGRLVWLGLQDVFPESGDAFRLLDRYGLGVRGIVRAVERIAGRIATAAEKH